ncbi:HPP family protein [Comamonas sp. JUb58]|uniref:HPP family protein n=1 Tax=Comamonas sp. JUb58 TaxID=2485114 RepID=UPI00105DA373|nr:HPP family protein [Comamonas sp. JUb58]TDS82760.1 CBS domain-containing membrane protein [Comamonas sp. JUb58]
MSSARPPSQPNSAPGTARRRARLQLWLRNFLPSAAHVNGLELARMVVGAIVVLWLTGMASQTWGQHDHSPWLFAAMGASAMLLIGTPSSPMAQPWPVIGGSLLSALAGWVAVLVFPDPLLAAAVAVGLAIMVMVVLRCLHPPGAALAMWMAIQGWHDVSILLNPVAMNLVILVLLATAYNRMTGKRYPAPQHSQKAQAAQASRESSARIEGSDLDDALEHFNGVLDVSRADLEALLQGASQAAFKRTLGNVRCEDVMSHPVHAMRPESSIKDAWSLMQQYRVKALPVVDDAQLVVGIITSTDLLNHALTATPTALSSKLKHWVLRKKDPGQLVGDLMTAEVSKVGSYDRMVDLIAIFSRAKLHHVPVVNRQGKLVGIISQTDLMREMAAALSLPREDG